MKTRDSTGGTVIESYRRRRIVPSCPAQRLTDDDDDKIISHSGSDEMPYLKLTALNYKSAVARLWYTIREHITLSVYITGAKPLLLLV